MKGLTKGFTPIKSGFTLIELLVVIAVLGVLAGGVMVAINPFKRIGQANDSKIKSDIGQISNAMQAYYVLNQHYPGTVVELVNSKDLKTEPKDPKGNPYTITDPDGNPCTTPCANIIISAPLDAPQATGGKYTWNSTTGQAGEQGPPPTATPLPPTPTPTGVNAFNPSGHLQAANCTQFIGWTCDRDKQVSIQVHFYKDSITPANKIGSTTANQQYDAAGPSCGGLLYNRYVFNPPAGSMSGTHRIYAYADNINSNGDVVETRDVTSTIYNLTCP